MKKLKQLIYDTEDFKLAFDVPVELAIERLCRALYFNDDGEYPLNQFYRRMVSAALWVTYVWLWVRTDKARQSVFKK